MNKKLRNSLLNTIWGLGYLVMGKKILGIGLLIALPFLHVPILVLGFVAYLTYPLILVLIGHLILTGFFIADAYVNTKN